MNAIAAGGVENARSYFCTPRTPQLVQARGRAAPQPGKILSLAPRLLKSLDRRTPFFGRVALRVASISILLSLLLAQPVFEGRVFHAFALGELADAETALGAQLKEAGPFGVAGGFGDLERFFQRLNMLVSSGWSRGERRAI
jgi:hypothetical protein